MRWRELAARRPADWARLAAVTAQLCAARLALAVLPYRTVRRLYARPAGRLRPGADARAYRERGLRAVRAGRRVLGARPCLPQALVAERLLRRSGADARIEIGAARAPDGALHAHAWVVSGGHVVAGGRGSERRYARFEQMG